MKAEKRPIYLDCNATTPLEPSQVLALAKAEPSRFRIVPPDRLLAMAEERGSDAAVLASAKNSLSRLLAYVSEQPGK